MDQPAAYIPTVYLDSSMSLGPKEVESAYERIRNYIRHTPLEQSRALESFTNGSVFLKMENQQVSGSFKARGAFNKILSIPEKDRAEMQYIAASTGNHAIACCTVLQQLGLHGKIVLPENVAISKLQDIKLFGVPLEFHGKTSLDAEILARKLASDSGYQLVHPYDDPEIVAGQGTVAIEIIEEMGVPDVVVIPVGGGGLISGICTYIKNQFPNVHIIGCQPERSPEMVVSIRKGKIIEENISAPTLSDGTAGGMEPNCMTYDICKQFVDEWLLLSETEIANGIRFLIERHQVLAEGAGALSIAAVIRLKKQLADRTVVCLVTGKRISVEKLKKVMRKDWDPNI